MFMAVRATGARVAGDIGCYTLGALDPLRGLDTSVAMGCSIGVATGMARAGESRPVLATIGDSTFLHAGLPALIDAVYNGADITVLLLDNHTTAMTGGQDHAGTGLTLRGEPAPRVDFEALVRAAGVTWVRKVDSYDLAVVHQTLREAIAHRGVSVVISDRPCVIDPVRIKGPALQVVEPQCNACQSCMNLGCPALTWSEATFPVGIQHPVARFHVRRLASGRILLVKHGETLDTHEGRSKLTAWLSDDEGQSWRGGLMLDERKGISYPDGFQTPEGTIYISYDRNRSSDGEILMARFTEQDVLAKQLGGSKSKLKMLVSRPLKGK